MNARRYLMRTDLAAHGRGVAARAIRMARRRRGCGCDRRCDHHSLAAADASFHANTVSTSAGRRYKRLSMKFAAGECYDAALFSENVGTQGFSLDPNEAAMAAFEESCRRRGRGLAAFNDP
jgi:hypothetical protein